MFFGTPSWAVPSLRALLDSDIEVAAVVTNPDKPAGRGLESRHSPVKAVAIERDIPVLQPSSARAEEFHSQVAALDADVATVVAYGKILPAALLDIPPKGFVNLHFSLLPLYRGAAPVQRSLMNGDESTGVSIMVLTEGMDEGPVLASVAEEVRDEDTTSSLGERLAAIGAELLVDTLPRYVEGDLAPLAQDDEVATYAPKITNEEAAIEWDEPASAIRNKVRGLSPDPGAWTTWRGKRVKILRAELADASGLASGEVLSGARLVVGAGEGALEITEIQPAGKRPMSGEDFARGARVAAGERMGE